MNMFRTLLLAFLIVVCAAGIYACPQSDVGDGPAEKAGEKMDDAAEDMGHKMEDVGDKAEDVVD